MKLLSLGTSCLTSSVDGGVVVLGVGKPLALLLYLSAAPNRRATRNAMISALWADLEPDAAKHALRQTLWYLKKKSGQDIVLTDDDSLLLSPAVVVDRDELLAASRGGDHARVVTLYGGPFVPTFAAPGCAGFEEWSSLERRRLLQVFRHSAESVVARQLTTGHAREAIALARRLRDEDVNNEAGWRLLIEACVSAGDLLAARGEAEALLQLADRDQLELEPATRAALRTVRAPASPQTEPAGRESRDSTLVGREEVFAFLLQAWRDTSGGQRARVHLTARAGHGKSRVLRDLATRIRAMRGRVVTLGGSMGIRDVPFAVASELAAALASLPGRQAISPESAAMLVALNPSLSTWFERPPRHVAPEDRLRASTLAVRELMTAVSFEQPVAVLIDDLHWWDDVSSALLAAAIEGLGESRVMLVTTGRPEARRTPLVATAATTHLALDPLTAPQVEELVLSIASLPAEPWAMNFSSELWRASRGSPLLVIGMLQHLEERGLLRRSEGMWATQLPDALNTELQEGDVLRTRLGELDRSEMWLLTLLAAGGSILPSPLLVTAADRGHDEVVERLSALEGRGFVVRHEDGWGVSHDEIADEVRRLVPEETQRIAAGRVGRALAGPPLDEARARRAAQLLRHSDEARARLDLFLAFGAHRYDLGDRRPVSAIAADLLGAAARREEIAELQRGAPLTWRFGLVSPMRRWAALFGMTAVVGMGAVGVSLRVATPPADAVLALAYRDTDGKSIIETVEWRQSGWSPLDTLIPTPWVKPGIELPPGEFWGTAYDSRSRTLVTTEPVTDSGTLELFMYEPGRPRRAFTRAVRDDGDASFSPDGNVIVFSTARWDTLYHYDLAWATRNDSSVYQLTRSESSDGAPVWFPDGSRVVFGRSNWGRGPNELCSIGLQGGTPYCRPVPGDATTASPVGWIDRERLVVNVMQGSTHRVSVMHWTSGELTPLLDGPASAIALSPDGGWLLCKMPRDPSGNSDLAIVPVAAPSLARPIRAGHDRRRKFQDAFWILSQASLEPARVRIAPQPVAQAGSPVQLRATYLDARGNQLQLQSWARWRVSDRVAGTIDSLRGVLIPSGKRPTVTVIASAGIGTEDSLLIPVRRDSARLVFDDRWDAGLALWLPFGEPPPIVTRDARGRAAFYNNGDGSYHTGVLTRSSFDAWQGLVVDVELRTPITERQWQTVRLFVLAGIDTARYANRSGVNPFPEVAPEDETCSIGYPIEGRSDVDFLVMAVNARESSSRVSLEQVADGRPWKLRLQVLPDGRCLVAVNGTIVAIVDGGKPPARDQRVMLAGNTRGTRIEVGRVRVFEGVWTDAGPTAEMH